MDNFYCLYNSESESLNLQDRLDSLKESCESQDVNFIGLNQLNFNENLMPLGNKDALFNCSKGSYLLETKLMNKKVKSIYANYNHLNQNDDSNFLSIELQKNKFEIPKTIFFPSKLRHKQIEQVKSLGGFPLVVKVLGNSSGVGVMLVDSFESFFSLIDYLFGANETFIFREYIQSDFSDRVAVLGDKVLYALRRPNGTNDFRSNGHHDGVYEVNLNQELCRYLVQATHACNLNFAGLDIIYDADGKAYILEINAPFNFAANELKLGRSVSLELIKWFIQL